MPPPPTTRCGLARALSKLGYCSRGDATMLIKMGRVTVNREVRKNPEFPVIVGTDMISVDGVPVDAEKPVYLMLNKPRGLITTASDEKGRDTIFSCLEGAGLPAHLSAVGRLDMASEGLLLITNDTAWATAITDPTSHVDKVYHVQIDRAADDELLRRMKAGVKHDGEKLRAKEAVHLRPGWLAVTLDEGKNRQIRRLLEALGCEVTRLVRVSIGPLQLGALAKGAWRHLTPKEVERLRAVP